MDIGIGMPNTAPWAKGPDLVEWARRADAAGFSTLTTIGRVAYPSHDDLTALAGAAGATSRIGLMTNILLGPTHNPILLAKQAATVHSLSGGRFRLGIAVGGRPDDFEVVGADFATRGRHLDRALETMTAIWRGQPPPGTDRPVVPEVPGGTVPLMMGGTSDRTIERVVRYGTGWTAGGAPPDAAGAFATRVRDAWATAGKEGRPRTSALAYFALGDGADEGARRYLLDYHAFLGEQVAGWIVSAALTSPEAIRAAAVAFEAAGVDEFVLCGTVPEPDQVDLLADAALTS